MRTLLPFGVVSLFLFSIGCAGHSKLDRPCASIQNADEQEQISKVRRAVVYEDDATARVEIATLLEMVPTSPHAFLELTFVELNLGDLKAAAAAAEQLQRAAPDTVEGRLVSALVHQRQLNANASWMESFRSAWNAAGRPDLSGSVLLGTGIGVDSTDDATVHERFERSQGAERYALALAMSPATADVTRVIRENVSAEENPGIALVGLEMLTRHTPPVEPDVLTVREQVVNRLVERFNDQMMFPLLRLDAGPEWTEPLSPADVAEMQRIAALPAYAPPDLWPQTHAALRERFERAGIARPSERAYMSSISVVMTSPWGLSKRLENSAGLTADQKRSAAEALWVISKALAERATILEAMVGTMVMENAAAALQDPVRIREAARIRQQKKDVHEQYGATNIVNVRVQALRNELTAAFLRSEQETMKWLTEVP